MMDLLQVSAVRFILALAVLLSGLGGRCTVSGGDGPVPVQPAASQLPGMLPASSVAAPELHGPHDLPSGAVLHEGYWLISSRHCPAPDCETAPCCVNSLACYHTGMDGIRQRVTLETFRAMLDPEVPVCFVVHGSLVSQQSLCETGPHLYRWIRMGAPGCPIQVVYFSWPSAGPISYIPHVDVAVLGRRAALHGYYLAQVVSTLPPTQDVSFFGHSHGARLVASCLHLLGGGYVKGRHLEGNVPCGGRYSVVFAAAAIDHHWLNPGERYGRALSVTQRVLNIKNRRDIALAAYPLRRMMSRRALGRHGLTFGDRSAIDSLLGYVTELDVTALVSRGHLWHNYHDCPEISVAMAPYIYFHPSADLSRRRQEWIGSMPAPGAASGR